MGFDFGPRIGVGVSVSLDSRIDDENSCAITYPAQLTIKINL